MKRRILHSLAVCGLLGSALPAAAQYPTPYPIAGSGQYGGMQQPNAYQPRVAPPVSPYLNLLQRGNPGVNYYNFVRPATQPSVLGQPMGPSLASTYLPEDIGLDPQDPTARMPRPTGGHPTGFMSYQSYFNTSGTIAAPAQRGGGAQRPPLTPVRR